LGVQKTLSCGVVMALVALGCSSAPPEMQLLRDAAEAMGGVEAIMAAPMGRMDGSGRAYALGQNVTTSGPLPERAVESYRVRGNFAAHQFQAEIASANFLGIIGTTVEGLDGDVAYLVGGNGAAQQLDGAAARARQAQYYHHPLMLVRAALDQESPMAATVSDLRDEMGETVVDIATSDGIQLSLFVDPDSGLPSRISSMSSDVNLGDVTITSTFSDWAITEGGLRLPGTIRRMVDEFPALDLTVSYDVSPAGEDVSAPADLAPPAPPVANVTVEELADGVWCLAGESHHSVLVAFPEFGVLVESPQHDTRTLAVIARARELLGDLPLTHVVNTHHHFDHSGGVRAAVAEGLTVVTHEDNADLYATLVARPHTLAPDHLALNPQPLELALVTGDEVYEITGGARTLQVFRVTGDPHNAGMLAAYLPAERILIEADDYTPGRGGPSADALLRAVRDRGLTPQRIAPLHGQVVPFSDLETQVAADAAPPAGN
jgi:glyoxylase-like metal-dependent hydrolase (beta-lactamase superfamily II)